MMKSDEALWQDVEQALRWERSIDVGQIRVHVRDGVVTLVGTVPNLLQKQIVEKIVQEVSGCRALVMELSLPPESPYVKSDESLAKRIVAALARMHGMPAERVHVETERGCVLLTGSVATDAQRREIGSLVGRIDGVVGVSNRLILCEPSLEDVVAQISTTLGKDLRAAVDNIRVDSSDGVVTLSGTVGSLDEKRAACLAASKAKGVREVIDRLDII